MSEFRDPEHSVRVEVRAYVDEVETWLRDQAEAGGLSRPGEVATQIRLLVAGCFEMAFATSSTASWADGRAAAIAILAGRLGTTPEEFEKRIASGTEDDRSPSP